MKLVDLRMWLRRHPFWSAGILCGLAILGYANYLFSPHGSEELARLEQKANACTPIGSPIDEVRSCLQDAGLEVGKLPVANQDFPLFFNREVKITAHKGEIPVHAISRSGAHGPFPIEGTYVEVVLVFSSEGILKERYVGRVSLGP